MFGTYARNVISGQGRYTPSSDQSSKSNFPMVSLERCEYDKKTRVLTLASEYFGMPLSFIVESHKTKKRIRFVTVNPGDALYDQDGWDGEMQIYRPHPDDGLCNVSHMIIYNQY